MAIVKIVLVAFIVVAIAILVARFIRNSRAQGFPTRESTGHFDQMVYGATPPTPKPEWVTERERPQRD